MAKSITYNDTPDGYAQKQSFVIQYDQIEMLADSPEDIALIVCFIKDIDDFLANDTGFDFAAKYGDSPAIKYCLAGALSAEKSNVRKWAESQKKALKASYSSKYRDFKGLDSRARVSDEDFYQFIDGTPVGARYRAILERISLLSEHRLDANLIKHVKPTSTLRMLVAPSSISKKPLETETVTVTETDTATANATATATELVFETETDSEKGNGFGRGAGGTLPAQTQSDLDGGICPRCGGRGLDADTVGNTQLYACRYCGYQITIDPDTGEIIHECQ